MRRLTIVLVLTIAGILGFAWPTEAAAQAACQPGAFRLDDMAGIYRAPTMIVTVYTCGGVMVVWNNASGDHGAGYYAVDRLPGGGFVAEVIRPDPWVGTLDGTRVIGLKPAEPGWVQLLTISITGEFHIYRLQKIA